MSFVSCEEDHNTRIGGNSTEGDSAWGVPEKIKILPKNVTKIRTGTAEIITYL